MFTICSANVKFEQAIASVRDTFKKNKYIQHFEDKCIKNYLNKLFVPKSVLQTAVRKLVYWFDHCYSPMQNILRTIKKPKAS